MLNGSNGFQFLQDPLQQNTQVEFILHILYFGHKIKSQNFANLMRKSSDTLAHCDYFVE